MTREQFDLFVAECKRRGFTHVSTAGGPVALEDWTPYGFFDSSRPYEGNAIDRFDLHWINSNQASDMPAMPEHARGDIIAGVWTFTRDCAPVIDPSSDYPMVEGPGAPQYTFSPPPDSQLSLL